MGARADDVRVVDYGIRGMHLAYDLLDGYDALVLVDAVPHGARAGDLTTLEQQRLDRTVDGCGHGTMQSRPTQDVAQTPQPQAPATRHTWNLHLVTLLLLLSLSVLLAVRPRPLTIARTVLSEELAVLTVPQQVDPVVVTQDQEAGDANPENHQTHESAGGYGKPPAPATGGCRAAPRVGPGCLA